MASPACPQPCWPHCPPTEGLGREQCRGPSRSRSYCVQERLILQAPARLPPRPHPLVPRTGDEFPNWRPGALPLAARGETQDSPGRWDSFPKGTGLRGTKRRPREGLHHLPTSLNGRTDCGFQNITALCSSSASDTLTGLPGHTEATLSFRI